jgi:hypothetical protein
MLIATSKFLWDMEINNNHLKAINAWRHGNDYFDAMATTEVNGTSKKPTLKMSPFVCLFEFGGRNGYWTSI